MGEAHNVTVTGFQQLITGEHLMKKKIHPKQYIKLRIYHHLRFISSNKDVMFLIWFVCLPASRSAQNLPLIF